MIDQKKTVVIIGAGPAGLTAALELSRAKGFHPIVLEASNEIGGISRTVNYKGYRMDIGGHRFFSKSDWVMNWWQEILPIRTDSPEQEIKVSYQNKDRIVPLAPVARSDERIMLVRNRLSRIYYLRKFFDYPIKLSLNTLRNLGIVRVIRVGVSYMWAMAFPRRPEKSLEDFLINRFGNALYRTFFKDYTEKVWGVPCHEISAEWGAQRIKGLSIVSAIKHALTKAFRNTKVDQKTTNTSLIERFLYPKLGPGQLWEEVARQVVANGGTVKMQHKATRIHLESNQVVAITMTDYKGESARLPADFVISTMPIKDLIAGMTPPAPNHIAEIATALPYRDFITVGLLLKRMKKNPQSNSSQDNECPPDNWIYVQESDVKLGRIQVFNNWSPNLLADANNVWLGLEYFCQEGDELWQLSPEEMSSLAIAELEKIGLIGCEDVLDSHVVKVPKTYPAYFGAYEKFDQVRHFVDSIPNLFLVGRNGMHRYNNQDHSMLTAKLAVESIYAGNKDKSALWAVNIDDDYHEENDAK